MTDDELEAIEARTRAATPGPRETQAWGEAFPGSERLARSLSVGGDEFILVGGDWLNETQASLSK